MKKIIDFLKPFDENTPLNVKNNFSKAIDVNMATVQYFSDDAFISGKSTVGQTASVIFELRVTEVFSNTHKNS